MPKYIENTSLAILGVVGMAIVAMIMPINPLAEKIVLCAVSGLIGYIARGNESKV